jgi:hypothetical protein
MKQPLLSRFNYLLPWLGFVVVCFAAWLRLWQVHTLPPAPYWEEVALGYDAYSIVKTGKDHHGADAPLVAFESFGDWKPSGYFYALVPSIAVFGLQVFAVRLPSVLAGIGLVWLFPWFLTVVLGRKLTPSLELGARLVAALSPWLIVFARGGWEVNVAFFLMIAGCLLWHTALKKQQHPQFWLYGVGAVVLLVAAMYTYHALRLIAPFWALLFTLQALPLSSWKKSWLAILGKLLLVGLLAVVLLLPILQQLRSPIITQRFQETSIFSDPQPVLVSNQLRADHDNAWWARIIYHRHLFVASKIAANMFDHLRLDYLFVTGDANARHRGPMYGQLLYPDALLIALGILVLVHKRSARFWLLVGLWATAVLPAALTTATPHALRTLPTVFIWLTLVVEGWYTVLAWWKNNVKPILFQNLGTIILLGIYAVFFLAWWRSYLVLIPKLHAQDWQYGYENMIQTVTALQNTHPTAPTTISRVYGRPAMFWWFYTKTDPQRVQLADALAAKDQGEFLSFESLSFTSILADFKPGSIVVLAPTEWATIQTNNPTWRLETQSTIYSPNYQPIWLIGFLTE